ncbi:DUF998 domain-containing protein [Agromyces aurantiacus]|uniref:DUF998 domain-containing protein n=1 Tax=Agromyces aurantiacus TaxID=165814 RepID=A0ABV9R511_9MICO|nr:DUF998 domain-containing protein [Agromyces aurantiacus]MBM7503029.1 putative membrane protein [Agromyces aurantiacus]
MTAPSAASAAPASTRRRLAVETEALAGGGIVAAIAGIITALITFGQVWPLWGGWSVGAFAAISIGVSGLGLAAAGYWRSRNLPGQEWRRGLRAWKAIVDVVTVSAVHAIIAAILAVVTFAMLQRSFEGLVVDGLTATGATAASAGLSGYWIYLSVSSITTNRLATLLVFFMASATLASMATAQDPQWWEYHFSQLGTADDFSSSLFNLALIVAGGFVTTFAIYVHRDLTTLVRQGVLAHAWAPRFISVVFIVMGVMLAGVGLFPLNVSIALHNSCAIGMSLSFLALLVTSPWTLKGMPARFFWFCAGGAVLLLGGALLFEPVGYYNLTAFELLAFATIFGWISVFIRFVNALAERDDVSDGGYSV